MSTATAAFDLPVEYRTLENAARAVAAEFAPEAIEIRRHVIEHGELHPKLWRRFCEQGWAGAMISADRGGSAIGLLGAALILEAFAARGIVLWMPVLSNAIAHAIDRVGPDSARERWLPRIAAGTAQLGIAVTEPASGHNLFGVETEIQYTGTHFVVTGVKRVTSGLDLVDRVLVFGRTVAEDGTSGYTTVLVDPGAAGVTVTEIPMRYREGVRQFQLELDHVVLPGDALVGSVGGGLLSLWPFTDVERVLTAAICSGSAAHCLDNAVARAKHRVIAGREPIGVHQAVAHPLAHLHARHAAVRLLLRRAALGFDRADSAQTAAADANAVKLLASELAFDAADHAMQVFGAEAWDEREGWLDLYLDARLSRSGPVSNEFALNYLAEHVLGLPAR
ncbi:acyl-CoA dehydrogenase family protein [Nocardia sp. NPDC005366]|uniref:acyl-CoA dehydrogenase family protein n=1 Tax=Nocardia sp. NPDC005366 TaxID=3156878 RepID=UPI0033B68CA9